MLKRNDRQILQETFTSDKAFTTTLLVTLVDKYGTESFEWAPDTIEAEINDDFDIRIPRPNMDRIMAGINLITTDSFYKSLPDFVNFCNVLAGDSYDPQLWDPADPTEIAWGITETALLAPPEDDDDAPFSEEITAYIGETLNDYGILTPPNVLKLALRDSDPLPFVVGEFSDDPIMFHSIYQLEAEKTADIDKSVTNGLLALIVQLESLPLRNGSAKNIADIIRQSFQPA